MGAGSQLRGKGALRGLPGPGHAVGSGLRASLPHLSPHPLRQLAATCNVESSPFIDWFSGHLNFQIEHQ